MINRLRWWLVRMMIGRSSVIANTYVEWADGQCEICVGPGLRYGNTFSGSFTTHTALDGSMRIFYRRPVVEGEGLFKGFRRKKGAPAMLSLHPDCPCEHCMEHFWELAPDVA